MFQFKSKNYTKSLEDEIDWKIIDQLHGVVSQISGYCFDIKKFCVTTLFVVMTLLAKFSSGKLDNSFFITGSIIPICFWLLDSIAYFYQVKLRGKMEEHYDKIRNRNSSKKDKGGLVINESRIHIPLCHLVKNAFFNHSMWIYFILLLINNFLWFLFYKNIIK